MRLSFPCRFELWVMAREFPVILLENTDHHVALKCIFYLLALQKYARRIMFIMYLITYIWHLIDQFHWWRTVRLTRAHKHIQEKQVHFKLKFMHIFIEQLYKILFHSCKCMPHLPTVLKLNYKSKASCRVVNYLGT